MIEKTPIPTMEMLRERREDLLQVAARRVAQIRQEGAGQKAVGL